MNDKLGEDGWEYDLQNAAEDPALCSTIAGTFVSDGVDLIMANATPALQAAAAATGDIPILGTSVTEYGVAFGVKDFSGTLGTNVSGTSDLAPLDQQAQMIQAWYPGASLLLQRGQQPVPGGRGPGLSGGYGLRLQAVCLFRFQ